jgi:hypothetical protein
MPAYAIVMSFQDAKGETSTTMVNVPTGITLANLTIFAQEMVKLVDNMIGGIVTRVGLAVTFALPSGINVAPAADSDVEEGGYFSFRTAGGYHTSLRIPTFLESLVAAGSADIDTSDPIVAAFVSAMITGIDLTTATPVAGTGTITPADSRGDDIVALTDAKEQFTNSR